MPSVSDLEMQIPSLCSIAGCSTVILTYFMFEELRKYRHIELVFYVTLNDLFGSIGLALGETKNGTISCWYQGFASNINFLSGAMWTVVIAIQLYIIVNGGNRMESLVIFHVACWGFPILVAVLVLTTNTYGLEDDGLGWCFISSRPGSPSWGIEFWEAFSFYIWLWLCTILIFIIYGLIARRIYALSSLTTSTQRTILRFSVYPAILVFCWAFNTYANLEINSYVPTTGLEAFFPAVQGFLNSAAFFASNKRVRTCWYQLIRKLVFGPSQFDPALAKIREGGRLQLTIGLSSPPESAVANPLGVFLSSEVSQSVCDDDDEDENYRPFSRDSACYRQSSISSDRSSSAFNSNFVGSSSADAAAASNIL